VYGIVPHVQLVVQLISPETLQHVSQLAHLTCVYCAALRLCLQDMAAFGYSDGSSRDQSSSMPVQL
jgi:hypothetical protein